MLGTWGGVMGVVKKQRSPWGWIFVFVVIAFYIGIRQANQGGSSMQEVQEPKYTVVENIDETGTLAQRIIVTGKLTATNLEALLRRLMPEDHNGNIWAYSDQAHVNDGVGWLGMIHKGAISDDPEVTIRAERIAALTAPETARLGLSEGSRKKIFSEIVEAETKAQAEADKLFPISGDQMTPKIAGQNAQLNSNYADTKGTEYKSTLAQKVHLTAADLESISDEAFKKNWAMSKP